MNCSNYNFNTSFGAKPIPSDIVQKTNQCLTDNSVKSVDIYCHSSADEDTVNSAKVISNWLTASGKIANICVNPKEAEKLYFDKNKYRIKPDNKPADKTVIIDFNAEERLNKFSKKLFNEVNPDDVLGYDHHQKSERTINKNIYIDDTAKSCCSIIYRFFEGLDKKLDNEDLKNLYCGMVSDYKKSRLLNITNKDGNYITEKTEKLLKLPDSVEVFDKIDKQLSQEDKNIILSHLEPLARLNEDEKKFQKRCFSDIKVSPNKKLAYLEIPPDDKQWAMLGMDNPTTSDIIKDLRIRVLANDPDDDMFSKSQHENFKDVNTVVVFYRRNELPDSDYKLSIHSSTDSAIKLVEHVMNNYDHTLIGGGHANRCGGHINRCDNKSADELVENFVKSSVIL